MSAGPPRKDRIDAPGAALLVGFSALLAVNQILIKLVNAGMNPVFQAGLRSAAAILPVILFARLRGWKLSVTDGSLLPGIVAGLFFAFEFVLLFQALEYTSVSRTAILFYTMPVWVALAAHFLIPGEILTRRRIAGLLLAVVGVVVALARNDHPASELALLGDMMALVAATGWAGVGLTARLTKLSHANPAMQLVYQLAVSAPVLLALSYFAGEPFRQMTPALWGVFAFQAVGVVAAGFMLWFWVLSIYPASDMASFAFLTPVFGVALAAWTLGEPLTPNILIALALVGAGIWLVNRKPRAYPPPTSTPTPNTSAPPSTT
jgi:drug/metabolite transporter (DMT)-like permease